MRLFCTAFNTSTAQRPFVPLARRARGEQGLALITTLIVLIVLAPVVALALRSSITMLRTTNADYEGAKAFYAAEAGGEVALSGLELALLDGVLTNAELANIAPPSLDGYTFTDFKVEKDGPSYTQTITDGPFAGMYSITQDITITSQATHESGAQSTILMGAKGQAIPMFQFGMFFEGAISDDAASRKETAGRVHSNAGIFLTGNELVFHDYVTTPNEFYRDGWEYHADLVADNIHIYIDDNTGSENEVTFDSGDTPDPDDFKAASCASHSCRLMTGAFGVDTLRLPLPVGMANRELIRPKEVDDTDAEKAVKYAWKADMYVTVDLGTHNGKSAECGGSAPPRAPSLLPEITITRPYGGTVPSDVDKCDIFRFRWESFYDNDEEGYVDVLDVEIYELRTWINGPGDTVSVIYVEFIDASVTNSSTTDGRPDGVGMLKGEYHPVLKIVDGNRLPGPLTVGSERPLWIQGDYNTYTDWQPSSLFGDRLGQLSNQWADSAGVDYGQECRNTIKCPKVTTDVTVLAAFIIGKAQGFVGCFHEDPGCSGPVPNGTNGSVKLLEDWKESACPGGRCTSTITGSWIYMWLPQYANNDWLIPSTHQNYVRPNRVWGFDSRFLDPNNLPPGTPAVGQVFRAAFRVAR